MLRMRGCRPSASSHVWMSNTKNARTQRFCILAHASGCILAFLTCSIHLCEDADGLHPRILKMVHLSVRARRRSAPSYTHCCRCIWAKTQDVCILALSIICVEVVSGAQHQCWPFSNHLRVVYARFVVPVSAEPLSHSQLRQCMSRFIMVLHTYYTYDPARTLLPPPYVPTRLHLWVSAENCLQDNLG